LNKKQKEEVKDVKMKNGKTVEIRKPTKSKKALPFMIIA